ncbi:TonB-linked SusC/RagA family outer membrane protein [Breznakibacter xylanolyticus]|uniref:TonB-linked SusC/RagA family outer membrane protein n=1 Tax=Breznakibacter xylanolyticus TaxID=990 RepID=A0A2W7N7Q4_9BACT|nr:TonB-dependent receptor [Breznakibacter xylanolyticus]PZX16090.1 TonB-linked SusC/RagA family outer membrane protein [Breznakibacter xylanolyticus]
MKYSYLILLGLLSLAPSTYAEGTGKAEQLSIVQTGNVTVKGKVVDENGESVPGATVLQKGTTNGIITDIDGNFTLSVPSDATLLVTFIGYKNVEFIVDGKTNLGNITLVSDTKELDQVVVVGYGTQKKADLTGSVAIVDAEAMKKVSNSNISTMLQGKASGVQITSDGQPGADPAVRIRGIGSFGDTNPLYVVDGVPMGTTIRDFSPNDIETIQVLKDASAAAIYGSRAANGVIIITTKQGKKNSPMKIDYRGYFGVDRVQKDVYNVMDADQYKQYVIMAYENSGMSVPGGYNSGSSDYLWTTDGSGNEKASVDTDWFDSVFKTGVRQNHNLNFSGGGENNTYNIGLDYYSQEGTMVGAGPNFERFTARINNSMDVKFIKIKTNIVYSHSDQDKMALSNASEYVEGLYGTQYPVMASALLTPPTIKDYDASTWVLDGKIPAATEFTYDSYGFGTYYDDVHGDLRISNVLLTNSLLERNTKVDRIVASASTNVDVLEMLGLKSDNHKFSYNLNLSYSNTHVNNYTFVPAFIQSTNVKLLKEDETLSLVNEYIGDGLIENTFNYNAKLGLHHFDAVLGQTFQSVYFKSQTGVGNNFPEPYYLQLSNAAEKNSYSYESEHLLASYIGRLNYNFDGKYLLSATARRDGSSRLSADDRFEIFPSVSAGWRIERENFFPVDDTTISLFKLRGSYGELGNENIGEYQYMNTMDRGNYTYAFANSVVTGSAINTFVNNAIRWEKKKTLDFGLDLAMFNNQLEFNFDWYKSTSEDLLYYTAIPSNGGFNNSGITSNAATMINQGLEFLLTYRNFNRAVKYEISANVSTFSNEVTKLGINNEPVTSSMCRTEVGQEVGQFYGYVLEDDVRNSDGTYSIRNGIAQSQRAIDQRVNSKGLFISQNKAAAGDLLYKDLDEDGVITAKDQQFLGSGLPDFTYGINARVEWKGFDLTIAAFGAVGFQAVDFVDMALRSSYGATNKDVDLLNAWTPTNTDASLPRVQNKADVTSNDYFSDRYIQDASYLKLANVQLGYNCPDSWFGGKINGVRLYVSGQNLATISKYKGYNVDFAGGTYTPGYNYCSYPSPTSVMFGVNMSF